MLPWLCILSLLLIFHSAYTDGIYNLTIANYNQQHQVLDIGFADSSSSDPHQVYGVYMINSSCPEKHCSFCVQQLLGSYQAKSMINSSLKLEGVDYSCSYNLKEFTIQRCPSSKCELDFSENASCVSEYFNDSVCTGFQEAFVENDVSITDSEKSSITLDFPFKSTRDVYYNISLVESCHPLQLKHIAKINAYSDDALGLIHFHAKISMLNYCYEYYDEILIVGCFSADYCPMPVNACSSLSFNYEVVCSHSEVAFVNHSEVAFVDHSEVAFVDHSDVGFVDDSAAGFFVLLFYCIVYSCAVSILGCLAAMPTVCTFEALNILHDCILGTETTQSEESALPLPKPPSQTTSMSNFKSTAQFSTPICN